MAGNANQKLKTLYLMRFFYEQTDAEHGATIGDMLAYLEKRNICAERKSLYADIELLRDFGLDILATKSKSTDYRLLSRDFEISELKLLVDSVSASKFLTKKKSRELIKKLEGLASVHDAKKLRRSVFVDNRIKTMNETILYTVDVIHTTIGNNHKLSFKYFSYTPEKERAFRHGGDAYTVSPLSLVYNDENYYLYAFSDESGEIRTYRVDRMTNAAELNEPRIQCALTDGFDPAEYSSRAFDMFSGERERVSLLFSNSLSTVVIDRFGKDLRFVPEGDDHFRVTVDVTVSDSFLSWIFGFGDRVKILSPDGVKGRFVDMVKRTINSYE